jgi:hypothetical protein
MPIPRSAAMRTLGVAATLAAAAFVASAPSAAAKDDPAKAKADREALKKELKDKKCWYSYDLVYFVDSTKLKESRWDWKDPPPFKDVSEKKGGQLLLSLMTSAVGGEVAISIAVQKLPQYELNGSQKSVFSLPFSAWGKSVPVSKIDDMAQGFYEEWTRSATDVIKEKCHPPKKKAVGPAEWYSTAVGTDKDSKKRERHDWYVWGTTGAAVPCTWIGEVTIAEKFIDNDEFVQKSEDVMKNMKEITDKRAKQ